jgi:hypothetical protein
MYAQNVQIFQSLYNQELFRVENANARKANKEVRMNAALVAITSKTMLFVLVWSKKNK